MSITTEHQGGFVELTGKTFGVIRVLHIARRVPLAWRCACNVCGSEFTLSHTLTQYGQCPRGAIACRRPAPVEVSQGTMTRVYGPPAVRQQPAPVVEFKPSAAALANPAGVKAMLDAARRKERA